MKKPLCLIKNSLATTTFLRTTLICFLFSAFIVDINAAVRRETFDIKGTVKDENGIPVANVAVFVKESTAGTVTNLRGYFEINGIAENSLLQVNHSEYVPFEITVKKSTKELEIALKRKPGWVAQSNVSHENGKASDVANETLGSGLTLERWPRFPGGNKELVKFLAHHLQYPAEALQAGIEGQAFVSFFLDEKGNISSPVIVNGPGWGIDEEAVRLVQQMPQWTPARQNGKAVAVRYTMVIPFDLEIQKLPIHIREKQPDFYTRKSRLSVFKPLFSPKSEFKAFFERSIDLSEKEAPKTELNRYYMISSPVVMPVPAVEMKFRK
ncbi:TonB family protein [Dyadobacter sp. CY326]|uniref:TonB family protein n=1 Tax=Dyadobacter sp. CY326 TaxID=2907300 RepID=UPI001F40A38A|nr:TonB family protein [Dyadobacter sp. CY326]MCE7064592.1 TonB family protein [Dyadobacter sp. CY326]